VHDEFAVGAGRVVLVEEGEDFADEGQRGLRQEGAVEGVVVVFEREPAQFESSDPLPLVPAAGLEFVAPFLEGCPAVGRSEDRSPEIDAFGIEGPGVAAVAAGAVLAEREKFLGIHPEERVHQVEVPRGRHRVVGQAGVLPPVARSPAAEVGVALAVGPRHGEERAIELDGIASASGAGVDEALEMIHPTDVVGIVAGRPRRRGSNPTPAPELRPPPLVGLATGGEVLRFDPGDQPVHFCKPFLWRRGVASEDEDAETMLARGGRAEMQVVEPLAAGRRDDCAEGAMEQRVRLLEALEALESGEEFRPERFHVVVIPPDPPALVGEHGVGLDDRRPPHGRRGAGHDVADLDVLVLEPLRPPQLDGRGSHDRAGARDCDVGGGVVRIHPQVQAGLERSAARLDLDGRGRQIQALAERLAFGEGIRLQVDSDLAHLDQAGVVVPGIALGDEEEQVAAFLDPGVQCDVAVAQGHRTQVVPARRVPHDVVLAEPTRGCACCLNLVPRDQENE